jgi:HEXXH motif-containing protein
MKAPAGEFFAFDPSAERAAALDHRMRQRLGDSLHYIAEQAAGNIAIPPTFGGFLDRLSLGPVTPSAFAAYADLVLAIDGDDLDEAARLFAELADAPSHAGALAIIDFTDPLLDRRSDRYRRYVDTDVANPYAIMPPPGDVAMRFRRKIADAFALLDRGNPMLAAEMRALLREIILIDAPETADFRLEGASSFMLWGGIVLNAQSRRSTLDLIQSLAHESAHNLLFGLCADGPLDENDVTRRYDSPLRADPRPMDGIVHATYVVARMHQSVSRLLAAGVLDEAQCDEADAALATDVAAFARGVATIDRHAILTARGAAVLAGARGYMARMA